MIIGLKKYIEYIKTKGADFKGSVYAQILKNERIKRNMTLNDFAEGVCSISYLSKLENGAIKSNESFYEKLFEKIQIDYKGLDEDGYDKLLDETIKYYFNNDHSNLEINFEKIKRMTNIASNSIIKCFYYLKLNYTDLFKQSFKELNDIKETFGYYEACCFIYLAVEHLIKMNNYQKALIYLKNLELLEIKNKYLNFLILERNILVSAFLGKSSRVIVYYQKINQLAYIGYPSGRMLELRLLYNLSLSDEFAIEVLEDIESINYEVIPEENRLNILYYVYLIKIKYSNLKNVFEDIYHQGYFIDPRFFGLLGYCAYFANVKEYYRLITDLLIDYPFSSIDKIHDRFTNFISLYSSKAPRAEVISTLRNEIIPSLNEENFYLYHEIYIDVYMSLLKEESHYKEAFNYMNNQRTQFYKRSNKCNDDSLNVNKIKPKKK